MAHMACITNGLTGLLFASFEMARRLRADGHQITSIAPSIAKDAVIREGLPYQEIPEVPANGGSDINMDRLAERLDALSPDLALIDTELPEVVLAAQAAGLKTVLLNTWMSIWQHPGLPPLHRSIQPGVGWRGSSLGMDLAWARHRTTRRLKHVIRRLWHGRRYRVAQLRTYGSSIGFPHEQEFDFDHWLLPFSFRTLPILTLHAHEFEFPHTPRAHVHYVGPMVNSDRVEAPSKPSDQAIIDEVLAKRRDGTTKLVFGGFGSHFIADADLLNRVFEAFAGRSDWELVVPLGSKVADLDMSAKPANVHVVSWAPQLALLKQADAAIVHGGINTIDECIHFETPMLACSGGMTDMPGNIARLVHHGLGVACDAGSEGPEAIAKILDRLMTDPTVSSSLKTQRSAAERYVKERVLEQTIDRFLDGDLAASAAPLKTSASACRRDVASMP
ncbi:MAG: nucleotide disphospho-sugar-binding domain-containing protein [Pseudomonadota bacterium]